MSAVQWVILVVYLLGSGLAAIVLAVSLSQSDSWSPSHPLGLTEGLMALIVSPLWPVLLVAELVARIGRRLRPESGDSGGDA